VISDFISIWPYTNDRRRLNRESSSKKLRCGVGGAVPPPQKILEFYYWKCYIFCILLACVVTIICGHWLIGGIVSCPSLSTPLRGTQSGVNGRTDGQTDDRNT